MDAVTTKKEKKPRFSVKEITIGIISLLLTVALCVVAVLYKDSFFDTGYFAKYGLIGMLIIAFLGGNLWSVMAVPVPYWLIVFTLPSVLAGQFGLGAPLLVGLVSALGASLGQLVTFMVGYGSRDLSQKLANRVNSKFYDRAIRWAERHGSVAVFVMSAVVNPLHLPMTMAIAALRYPSWKFFIYSFLGNEVKSTFIAFCGYFGLTSLFHFLGF